MVIYLLETWKVAGNFCLWNRIEQNNNFSLLGTLSCMWNIKKKKKKNIWFYVKQYDFQLFLY